MEATSEYYPKDRKSRRTLLIASNVVWQSKLHILVGDGTHLRVSTGTSENEWVSIRPPRRTNRDFHPTIVTDIDLIAIRNLIFD